MLKNERGTLIIEASFALIVFIAGVASIISLINVVTVHNKVQHVIHQTAKELAAYGYIDGLTNEAVQPLIKEVTDQAVKLVAKRYFGSSEQGSAYADTYLRGYRVKDGLSGLDFGESLLYQPEGETGHETVEIVVSYCIEHHFPFTPFPRKAIHMKQKVATRAWTDGDGTSYGGQAKSGSINKATDAH